MPPSPPPPSPPETFDLTLEEFCARKSNTDNRVEMLGGFYADELRHGRVKDSEDAYVARLAAFETRPA